MKRLILLAFLLTLFPISGHTDAPDDQPLYTCESPDGRLKFHIWGDKVYVKTSELEYWIDGVDGCMVDYHAIMIRGERIIKEGGEYTYHTVNKISVEDLGGPIERLQKIKGMTPADDTYPGQYKILPKNTPVRTVMGSSRKHQKIGLIILLGEEPLLPSGAGADLLPLDDQSAQVLSQGRAVQIYSPRDLGVMPTTMTSRDLVMPALRVPSFDRQPQSFRQQQPVTTPQQSRLIAVSHTGADPWGVSKGGYRVHSTLLCPNGRQTPNQNNGRRKYSTDMIILHYTGGTTVQKATDHFCKSSSQASSHYIVDVDGTIYRYVNEDQKAFHAGTSYWNGRFDLNPNSIGIEIVNDGGAFYPALQMRAVTALVKNIMQRYDILPERVIAHADVTPPRRPDPGERFDWLNLWDGYGIGAYIPAGSLASSSISMTWQEAGEKLRSIGYRTFVNKDTKTPTSYQTRLALLAFCRHYCQEYLRKSKLPVWADKDSMSVKPVKFLLDKNSNILSDIAQRIDEVVALYEAHRSGNLPALSAATPAIAPAILYGSPVAPASSQRDIGLPDGWREVTGDRFILDLRYNSTKNLLNRNFYAPYGVDRCYVHPDMHDILMRLVPKLEARHLKMVLYDCGRPLQVQFEMYETNPDYVGDPSGTKKSPHNRGVAVDVGLAHEDDTYLQFPTDFDGFTDRASMDYQCTPDEAVLCKNRMLLHGLMIGAGLEVLSKEWWHYRISGYYSGGYIKYPVFKGRIQGTLI